MMGRYYGGGPMMGGSSSGWMMSAAGYRSMPGGTGADHDMAHGLVITAAGTPLSPVPMMTATPAFGGAAPWFLGEPTSAGMHAGTLSFTATRPWSYRYLCPVPGHAQEGMSGSVTVESTS